MQLTLYREEEIEDICLNSLIVERNFGQYQNPLSHKGRKVTYEKKDFLDWCYDHDGVPSKYEYKKVDLDGYQECHLVTFESLDDFVVTFAGEGRFRYIFPNDQKYQKETCIQENKVYLIKWQNQYSRGLVQKLLPDNIAEVELIDSGHKTIEIDLENVFQLDDEKRNLAPLGKLCQLDGVKSKEHTCIMTFASYRNAISHFLSKKGVLYSKCIEDNKGKKNSNF